MKTMFLRPEISPEGDEAEQLFIDNGIVYERIIWNGDVRVYTEYGAAWGIDGIKMAVPLLSSKDNKKTNEERKYLRVTEKELDAIAKTYIFEHLLAWESLEPVPPDPDEEESETTTDVWKGIITDTQPQHGTTLHSCPDCNPSDHVKEKRGWYFCAFCGRFWKNDFRREELNDKIH